MAGKNRIAVGGAAAAVGLGALFARAGVFSDDALRYSRYTHAVPGINETVVATRLKSIATTVGRSEEEVASVLVDANAAEHAANYKQRLASQIGEQSADYSARLMCDIFEQRITSGSWPTIEAMAGTMAGNFADEQIVGTIVEAAVQSAVADELGRDTAFQIEATTVCDQLP